jgi:segregation and condensation protein A
LSAVRKSVQNLPEPEPLRVRCGDFYGSLSELAAELRAERLAPEATDLLTLTRAVLAHVAAQSLTPGEQAEVLPPLAGVIALKARLLLPRPPPAAAEDDWDDSGEEDSVLGAVEALAELGALVAFLVRRRSERSGLIAARPLELDLPRKQRPAAGKAGLARLVKAAQSAVREVQVPLLSRERLTLAAALRSLRAFGERLGHFTFGSVAVADWGERATYFSALLEGVKEGTLSAEQPEAFGDIEVRRRGL